ncbi:hypothetical protein [Algivirga pacifica]|uniref:DUF3592 domain-containing protein n=1 Tax=Algivirga pacifica TaxID=1162670 RepID=A0ABP9DQZ1_9BACT
MKIGDIPIEALLMLGGFFIIFFTFVTLSNIYFFHLLKKYGFKYIDVEIREVVEMRYGQHIRFGWSTPNHLFFSYISYNKKWDHIGKKYKAAVSKRHPRIVLFLGGYDRSINDVKWYHFLKLPITKAQYVGEKNW